MDKTQDLEPFDDNIKSLSYDITGKQMSRKLTVSGLEVGMWLQAACSVLDETFHRLRDERQK